MHLTLPPDRAREAIEAGSAELHPIARQMGREDLVLVYTPRTFDELEVLWDLVLDAYCYVTERPRPEPHPAS